jgi:tripartite ATP-independent transporter DctP family solute receptor
MKRMKGIFATGLLLAVFALVPPGVLSAADAIVIKASHDGQYDGSWAKALIKFKQVAEEKAKGKIKLELFHQGVLSNRNTRTTIQMLQTGSVHMALFLPAIYEQFDRRWQAFSTPYLFLDRRKAYDACDGEAGKYMMGLLEEKQIHGLSLWEHGFRHLTNSKKPIHVPADLAGMKIRVMDSPTFIAMFKSFKVNPTATSMGELFSALQQGVVDGQENPLSTIYNIKIYEAQKYLTLTSHSWNPLVVAMNKKFYDGLAPDLKQALSAAAEEVKPYARNLAVEEDEAILKILRKSLQVTTLSPQEMQVWKDATKKVREESAEKIGKDIMNKFYKATGE